MTQPDLLAWRAPSHANGSDTEHVAARSVDGRIGADCRAVLDALRQHGEMSSSDIADALGWPDVYRVRRRVSDLRHHSLVEDTRRRVMTAANRPEIVWRAVPR